MGIARFIEAGRRGPADPRCSATAASCATSPTSATSCAATIAAAGRRARRGLQHRVRPAGAAARRARPARAGARPAARRPPRDGRGRRRARHARVDRAGGRPSSASPRETELRDGLAAQIAERRRAPRRLMARFIAEIGSNHNRDLDRALALIDACAAAGAAAVKVQLFRIDDLFAPEALAAHAQLRARRAWELPPELLAPLAERCRERGLQFGATPFGLWAVEAAAAARRLPQDRVVRAAVARPPARVRGDRPAAAGVDRHGDRRRGRRRGRRRAAAPT